MNLRDLIIRGCVKKYRWPDLESNQGHKDFQSFALPTELSGPDNLEALLKRETLLESSKTLHLLRFKVVIQSILLFHCFQRVTARKKVDIQCIINSQLCNK